MTVAEFIAKYGVSSINQRTDPDPVRASEWDRTANHWRVTLSRSFPAGRGKYGAFTTPFSQGSAHRKPPSTDDVVSCLASDCQLAENCLTFEDFASELGYNPDSRKAERIYDDLVKSARQIRRWLGEEAFADLLTVQQD
jgi:hypothetical protein